MHKHTEIAAHTKRSPLAIKAESVRDDGSFAGYGSLFNVIDSYGDVVAPGAYAATLARAAADGRMPALLWQHDGAEPIGVWTSMREDEKGLWCEGRLVLDVARAKEAYALMKAGALSGLSIGFAPVDYEYVGPEGVRKFSVLGELPAGCNQVRVLKEIDLWEVSVVTFPACSPARVVSVKRPARRPPPPPPDLSPLRAAIARRGVLIRHIAGRL